MMLNIVHVFHIGSRGSDYDQLLLAACFSEENFSTISFTYHLITHYHITPCPFWDSFNLQLQIFSAAGA
jgi:hypothetical protein